LDEPPGYSFANFYLTNNLLFLFTTVVLLLLAGLVSSMEAAFFALTPEEVDAFRHGKSTKEKLISTLLGTPKLLLAVLTTWKYVMLIFGAVIFSVGLNLTKASGIFTESLVLTIAFAFFGVIVPKIYGTSRKKAIVKNFSRICAWMVRATAPVVSPLLKMSVRVERKLESIAEENSVKELTQALELAAADKEATEDEKEILRGIVNFGTLTVKDVMRPQNEINSVDTSLNFHDLLIYIKKSGFSRIPVYQQGSNKVLGILYIKDLLPFLAEGKKFNWHRLLRSVYFVTESKKIDLLLKDFQEKRVHLALAVDDSGEVSGLITLEDIIEEIIGDIHDEFDEVGAYYKKLDERTFIVDSKIPVHELCRILDVDPSVFTDVKSETESLGPVLQDLQEELPRIGDQIILDPFTFIIEAVDHKRIKKIRVHIHEQKEN
jgi:putative hemolysin